MRARDRLLLLIDDVRLETRQKTCARVSTGLIRILAPI